MTPENRAQRRIFETATADSSQFRLSVTEQACAQPSTARVPPLNQWIAHEEDVPHIAGKTVQSVIKLAKSGEPSVHLRGPNDTYLSFEQKGDWAVLTTVNIYEPDVHFAHGSMAATAQIPKDAHLWLACPCCGQGSICAPRNSICRAMPPLPRWTISLRRRPPPTCAGSRRDDFIRVHSSHG